MYISYVAAFLTTIAFLPQAVKTIKTRDTHGLSILMYMSFVIGVACWLVYGIELGDVALIVGNGVTLVLALPILVIVGLNDLRAWREGRRF
ncbi:MAG: SemiSWEET transporter [Parvibaculum sedimenti]|uniref:SemiSWEET transporter n=1 Tax=Parvibaculum sedimenti TaxID=2608632 RepID=UPI003BB67C73